MLNFTEKPMPTDRRSLRAMIRERVNAKEKAIAKAMNMPKGLRQFFARHGKRPSDVAQAYAKAH